MAQTAKSDTDKASNIAASNVTELSKQTADIARETTDKVENTMRHSSQVAQQMVDATADVERAVAHRSAAGVAEVGQAFAELATAQTRNNIEAFRALSQTVDWQAVTRIQSELVRANLERMADFSRRYVEVLQAVASSAVSVIKEQVHKAA